jgi:hypothetical protein
VNKCAAFDTFKVKMIGTALTVCKLIARPRALANHHFFNHPTGFKLFKGAVYGGGADLVPLLTQVKKDIRGGGV